MDVEVCKGCERQKPLHTKYVEGNWLWICAECDSDSWLAEDMAVGETDSLGSTDWCRHIVLSPGI